mmetsp:Transcript_17570/g.60050  ORF Transcript_17570/g.60050 Transcript_17570/m.60050 type:complete len:331 (-) Transcript_17570:63-1055(-)
MASSHDPRITSVVTRTWCLHPILCARLTTCSLVLRSICGSRNTTCLTYCMSHPAALCLSSRQTCTPPERKASSFAVSWRLSTALPSERCVSLVKRTPASASLWSARLRKTASALKTSVLAPSEESCAHLLTSQSNLALLTLDASSSISSPDTRMSWMYAICISMRSSGVAWSGLGFVLLLDASCGPTMRYLWPHCAHPPRLPETQPRHSACRHGVTKSSARRHRRPHLPHQPPASVRPSSRISSRSLRPGHAPGPRSHCAGGHLAPAGHSASSDHARALRRSLRNSSDSRSSAASLSPMSFSPPPATHIVCTSSTTSLRRLATSPCFAAQ